MGKIRWVRTRWGLIPAKARQSWLDAEKATKLRWKLVSEHYKVPDEKFYHENILTQRQLAFEAGVDKLHRLFSRHKPYLVEGKEFGAMRHEAQDLLQVTHWDQVLQYIKDCFASDKELHPSVLGWFDERGRWFPWDKPEHRYGKTSRNERAPHGWRIGFRIHPMALDLSDESLRLEAFELKNLVPVPRCMTRLWRPDWQ